MIDELAWTSDGQAALATEQARGDRWRTADREALRAQVEASFVRFAPCWERGLARAEAEGRAAVAAATAWRTGASAPSVDDLAGVLSLVGARSDGRATQLAELVIRDHGIAVAVRVLVRMWSLATRYDDPNYPDEARLAVWVVGITEGSDPSWVNDASVSHAKSTFAAYLGRRTRDAAPGERAEIAAAARAAWDAAPLWARPALAIAADDAELAERAARELFAASPAWPAHYARAWLPELVTDPELLDRLGFIHAASPSLRFLERLGVAALPLYERMAAAKLSPYQRANLVTHLVNVRGPRAAALLAPFAEKAPTAAAIRAYFTRYPELLDHVRAAPALQAHAAQLTKLAAKLAAPGGRSRRR